MKHERSEVDLVCPSQRCGNVRNLIEKFHIEKEKRKNSEKFWPEGNKIDQKLSQKYEKQLNPILEKHFLDEINLKRNTRSILVIKNGKIIAERHDENFRNVPQAGWSISKSMTNSFIAVAIKKKVDFTFYFFLIIFIF